MKITTVVVGEISTNCYLVTSDKSSETIIIDPGDEAGRLIGEIEKLGLKPVMIVNTHGHPDHIGANQEICKRYKVSAAMSKSDHELIKGWGSYFEEFADMKIDDLSVTRLLNEGDTVKAGDIELKVLLTPGHSKGSICLYSEGYLFSGDTLFKGDSGRTDIPGGSDADMGLSLSRLFALPAGTKVYPGHGRPTTIGQEAKLYARH